MIRKTKAIVFTVAALGLGLFLDHGVPRSTIVDITGTEIKRDDRRDPQVDVFFIQSDTVSGRPYVFRNEDSWWWLKFDSADLQAIAAREARGDGWARVRHTGWRIPILSMFPNALSIRSVDAPDAFTFPMRATTWFLTFALWAWLMTRFRLWTVWLRKPKSPATVTPTQLGGPAAPEALPQPKPDTLPAPDQNPLDQDRSRT